jgi:hypothetical protein
MFLNLGQCRAFGQLATFVLFLWRRGNTIRLASWLADPYPIFRLLNQASYENFSDCPRPTNHRHSGL